MLPKVASLPSLQGAATRSAWQRSSQAQHGRRKSIDVPNSRPRSRASSHHDLASLDLDLDINLDAGVSSSMAMSINIPRSHTPPLPSLWPLVESPTSSFSPDDALSHMAKLSASLDAARNAEPKPAPWVADSDVLPLSPTTPLSPISSGDLDSPTFHCIASVTIADSTTSTKAPLLESPNPAPIAVAAAVEEAVAVSPAAAEAKTKRKHKRKGPASRPGPGEMRVYRSTLDLDYVQELLGNLTHIKHMFRGVASAPSSTAAAAATAAARLLSRSLSRAAGRVRTSVKDVTAVHLTGDALATLAEFGWVELITENPEEARLMGCVEAEVHDLRTGRVTTYHRPAVDKSWWQNGEAALPEPTAAPAAYPRPGGGLPVTDVDPNVVGIELDVTGTGGGYTNRGPLPRGGLTVAALADHVAAAGQSVMAAANMMQQWLEEHKAGLVAGVSAAAAATAPAATWASSAERANNNNTPVVVGFAAPTPMVFGQALAAGI